MLQILSLLYIEKVLIESYVRNIDMIENSKTKCVPTCVRFLYKYYNVASIVNITNKSVTIMAAMDTNSILSFCAVE